jgi:glutathione synthase/RimK-type ligase-like ATP-grasp enzyme
VVPGTDCYPMYVVFATCDHQPLIAKDDQPLADALAARGVVVTPIPWTEIDPYALVDAPPIILRSTWDYHRTPTMFGAWLAALADSGRTTWNPPEVAQGNIDKIYLRALETAGIAIAKTRWLDRIDTDILDRSLSDEGWDRAVLKPRIAATAYGTFIVSRGAALSDDDLAPARAAGALLQEVVPEIVERGETSIVYAGGAFSHAVTKRAKDGEFRVQQDFGGRVEPASPSTALLSFAATVMTHVPDTCLYARVDVVESRRGPLLMELELIEPELYFLIVPEAADRLARLIVERLA